MLSWGKSMERTEKNVTNRDEQPVKNLLGQRAEVGLRGYIQWFSGSAQIGLWEISLSDFNHYQHN